MRSSVHCEPCYVNASFQPFSGARSPVPTQKMEESEGQRGVATYWLARYGEWYTIKVISGSGRNASPIFSCNVAIVLLAAVISTF